METIFVLWLGKLEVDKRRLVSRSEAGKKDNGR